MDLESVLSSSVTWCVTAAAAAYLFYWYGTSTFDYFTSQGIPGPKPMPYVGNLWGIWRETLPRHDRKLMGKYGINVGYFDGRQPVLWTTDLEIIRRVFVKDFEHFVNRRTMDIKDKYGRKMIMIIKDQEWKEVRSSVTPAFTTGRIKRMSISIKECADRLASKLDAVARKEGKIDAKREMSAFTMDVIARCAFGLAMENLDDKSNPMMEQASKAFNPPALKSPVVIIPMMSQWLMSLLNAQLFAKGFQYFINIIVDVLKQRETSNEKYHDFVEIAKEAVNDATVEVDGVKKPMWTKEEIDEIVVAQCAFFLLAGFDTTGTTLTSTIFLLARHPDIQEKLYGEVKKRLETHGEVKHEMVLNFPYMDNVIHETLRLYPPVVRVERQCKKDVTYNGILIKEGVVVNVPTSALHYDGDYYPEPETFNPDRWDTDSPIKPDPSAYMPFGMGPRNCVGMRFAMEEMKIALCTLIAEFRFFPVDETPETVEFEHGLLSVAQPIHAIVGIEPRS